jgi:hypothetical protein
MKIAIMTPLVTAIREPQRGGSHAFVSDLARGLAGRGHGVHVYAASGSEIPGVEVEAMARADRVPGAARRPARRGRRGLEDGRATPVPTLSHAVHFAADAENLPTKSG